VGSNGLIQTAAVNGPRFDHDPVTLASRGLLIEESRTNLILRSENFANAFWAKSGGSISSVANVAPDGSANSELFSEDGTTGTHRIFQAFVGTIGTVYTLSVFLKFNGRAEVSLENRSITGNPFVVFNIQNGTIGLVSAGLTAAIQAYPNGWYRCSVTGTATLAGGNYIINGYSVTTSYTGLNGPAFYIYGAQVEAGSFPTSYIPTTTASVVRSVDLCSISGSNFTGFWNQSAGTLVEAFEASPNTNTTYVSASNGNIVQNSLHLDNDTGLMRAVYYSGSALIATLDLGAVGTIGTVNTIATAYSVNNFAASRNGGTVVTDTSGAVPASLSQMNIGTDERSQTPTSFYSNRCIKSLRYYKKRLANAKLQTLST
jgi:hypothetical protein